MSEPTHVGCYGSGVGGALPRRRYGVFKKSSGINGILQGWLVMAFVCAERMARAGGGGQIRKAGCAGAAMLALVFGLLGSLIQGVFAFVRASRVAETG